MKTSTIVATTCIAVGCSGCGESVAGPEVPQVDLPILYVHDDVFVAPDTGGSVVNLTDDREYAAMYAEWSPTGEQILMWARASSGDRDLHVLDADGSNRVQISDVPGDVSHFPAWSPDGSRVAFSGDGLVLYIVDADGTNQRELASGDLAGINPDWSPDGRWIAYGGFGPEGQGIYRVRPDGSDREFLVSLGSWDDGMPRYSPDGERIAFQNGQDLYLIDADGGNLEDLTQTPTTGDWFPRWSPDGRRIAFHTDDGGTHWAIGVMELATREIQETSGHPSFDALYPAWAPDGQRIVFQLQATVVVRTVGSEPGWTSIDSGRYPSWHPGG